MQMKSDKHTYAHTRTEQIHTRTTLRLVPLKVNFQRANRDLGREGLKGERKGCNGLTKNAFSINTNYDLSQLCYNFGIGHANYYRI